MDGTQKQLWCLILFVAISVTAYIYRIKSPLGIQKEYNITTHVPQSKALIPFNAECTVFIEYRAIPPASTFFAGLFEHYFTKSGFNFSASKCTKHQTNKDDSVPKRGIKISSGSGAHAPHDNSVYIDVAREYCGDPNKYNDSMPTEFVTIAYNYYNWNTYSMRKHVDHQMYLPLFMRYDFGYFQDDIQRMIDDYETFSNPYEQRGYLVSVILSTKTGNRRNYRNIYKALTSTFGKEKAFIHLIEHWRNNNKLSDRYLNEETYQNILKSTQFNLCIDGNNPEAYRIWETLSCATIPVLAINTSEYRNHPCKNAFDPFILHSNNNVSDVNIDREFVANNIVFSRTNYKTNWYFYHDEYGFDIDKLTVLYESNQFSPFILLNDWNDAIEFFKLVNNHNSDDEALIFWNKYQKYLNLWFQDYIEFKQTELIHNIVNHFVQ